MNNNLQDLMHVATRLTRAGRLQEATMEIQRALKSAGGTGAAPRGANSRAGTGRSNAVGFMRPPLPMLHLDSRLFEPDVNAVTATMNVQTGASDLAPQPASLPDWIHAKNDGDIGEGEFISGTHTHALESYRYKLYVPFGHAGRQLPLVVMLHGCTQDPDDFAAGTGMNEAAQQQGFYVLYPAQSQEANPSRCWSWFKHGDQQREGGEPTSIAAMTLEVMRQHDIDSSRVYIAGLSAGGAMATIVAEAYPEIFAAVGVHSGLPRGSASTVIEAFAVMRSGSASRIGAGTTMNGRQRNPVPTIVFHGDKDQTVHPRNGEHVIAAVMGTITDTQVEKGVSPEGRHYTRYTHHDEYGNALAEHWVVHGGGHAWSGGDAAGTFTDTKGPDATAAMLRFFFSQPTGSPQAAQLQH